MSKHEQSPITGYLISPEHRTIETVTLQPGSDRLADIQRLLKCRTITSASFDGGDLYCDDEGLLGEDVKYFFSVRGKAEPIAGRGLVLDVDDDGEDVSARLTPDELKERVSFLCPFGGGFWSLQRADKLRSMELNTFHGHLRTLQQEAAA